LQYKNQKYPRKHGKKKKPKKAYLGRRKGKKRNPTELEGQSLPAAIPNPRFQREERLLGSAHPSYLKSLREEERGSPTAGESSPLQKKGVLLPLSRGSVGGGKEGISLWRKRCS